MWWRCKSKQLYTRVSSLQSYCPPCPLYVHLVVLWLACAMYSRCKSMYTHYDNEQQLCHLSTRYGWFQRCPIGSSSSTKTFYTVHNVYSTWSEFLRVYLQLIQILIKWTHQVWADFGQNKTYLINQAILPCLLLPRSLHSAAQTHTSHTGWVYFKVSRAGMDCGARIEEWKWELSSFRWRYVKEQWLSGFGSQHLLYCILDRKKMLSVCGEEEDRASF